MFRVISGHQDCWGISIAYHPEYRDISFALGKWFFAIGQKEQIIEIDFNDALEELDEQELDFIQDSLEYIELICELCDELVEIDEAIVLDGPEVILICPDCVSTDA